MPVAVWKVSAFSEQAYLGLRNESLHKNTVRERNDLLLQE